jgi:phosphoenolpyruvate---glycerone phosphotransferase subunit DhaL
MGIDFGELVQAVANCIFVHADELTELDSAIGDADHGLNMKRGFEAIMADRDKLAALPLPDALKSAGMTLVMKVGGASGPLYGTLFMTMGKELPENPGRVDVALALAKAVDALKARGKADFGDKTMLDVLGPAADHLALDTASFASVRAVADASANATMPLKANKGRASFLGERSMGHMDPGARSSALMIKAVCDVMEKST